MSGAILDIDQIKVRYAGLPILHGVSLSVNESETVSVVGGNGAGKSTLLRAIMGAQRAYEGKILFQGREIQGLKTESVVRLGIVYVPEEKMLFKPLSVQENLLLGAYTLSDRDVISRNLEFVYHLFPKLEERRMQAAGTLSGGEQQMVAIGRGLMSNPKILMLDEPSLGLAPLLVKEIFDNVQRINRETGTTILVVEQNARIALEISDYAYIMESGKIVLEGPSTELQNNPDVKEFYMGLTRRGGRKSFKEVKSYKRRKRWM